MDLFLVSLYIWNYFEDKNSVDPYQLASSGFSLFSKVSLAF